MLTIWTSTARLMALSGFHKELLCEGEWFWGIWWFRLLLKNDELGDYWKRLTTDLKFGILFAPVCYQHLNPFLKNPLDYERIRRNYKQPIINICGDKDPFMRRIKSVINDNPEFPTISHDGAHSIPRLTHPNIDVRQFLRKGKYFI